MYNYRCLSNFAFSVCYRLMVEKRNKLRATMRGYRHLKHSNRLSLISDLQNELRDTSLSIPSQDYSPIIFGASHSEASLIIRQTLANKEKLISRNLLQAIGKKGSTVILPLPMIHLRVIEAHYFKVSYTRSRILLLLNALKYLVIGSARIGINLIQQFKPMRKDISEENLFVYFCDLVLNNLPRSSENSGCYSIVNWYEKWQGRDKTANNIGHGIRGYKGQQIGDIHLFYRRSPLPVLVGAHSLVKYITWALKAIFISTFDLLRGRWWHAMLLQEASFAALVRYGDKKSLARQYFFHNSRFYPPLWTYELPQAGSEAVFYWYSTNSEPLQRQDGLRPFAAPHSLMNWPRHLVWDESQANFVRRCEGRDPRIEIVGPIWFEDSDKPLNDVRKPTIAIFDIQPHRASRYCLLAMPVEYCVPRVANKFLTDIAIAASNLNIKIIWKKKRDIGKRAHPSYSRCTELLALQNNISIVDPSISAIRVIEKADLVISMPFTSTALAARHLNKPSIYYDPSFIIGSSDPAAHDIPILHGSEALSRWLLSQVSKIINVSNRVTE